MADEIQTAIQENALGPAEANIDGRQVKNHSLKDQIEADMYLSAKAATARDGLGVKLTKLNPPGAV